jgi:hypothetical protein
MAGPIKIGFSETPERRLTVLATWSPFKLEIAVKIPGTFDLERRLHGCFADCYSHREWFLASPKLLRLIEALKAGTPIEEAIDLNIKAGDIPRLPCGGAAWKSHTRQYMGLIHKVRFAVIRAEKFYGHRRWEGPAVRDLIHLASKRFLTAAEMEVIDDFILNSIERSAELYPSVKARPVSSEGAAQ